MMRHVKIVCTLGPATANADMIEALVAAGMDCARLNFSHGDFESHALLARHVRQAAIKQNKAVAVLADLTGPKLRIGRFRSGAIELRPGEKFTITTRAITGDEHSVSVNHGGFADDMKPGIAILLDDGLLRLRVLRIEDTDVVCEVEIGGELSDNKGMNVPGTQLSIPSLTDKDKSDLAFAVDTLKADYLALSFVRTAEDVSITQALAKETPVIAKIEKPEALENLDAIADTADGVMIARGDLGVEVGPEKVPVIQKHVISQVNKRNKVVITATQMLDSMMRNSRPTRAEAADVANAVLDGSDALMLSGETASGRYPLESVRMMDAIIQDVENATFAQPHGHTSGTGRIGELSFPNAAAGAAALLSSTLPIKAFVTFTRDGRTAGLLSSYRRAAPIVAITAKEAVANRLAINWGVLPFMELPPTDMSEVIRVASALLVREKICKKGDIFVLVLGWPPSAPTNTVKLHRL
ncbi:MAG: pyruvate kinase [Myxococcales bacterium]|nr:pyruvate kinase [Myxococcales bacterium]MCB9709528.1 pyruvate kinase [Myxococcales bacterium]